MYENSGDNADFLIALSWVGLGGGASLEIRPASSLRSSDAAHGDTLRPPLKEVKRSSGDFRGRNGDCVAGFRRHDAFSAVGVYPPWRAVSAVKRTAGGGRGGRGAP